MPVGVDCRLSIGSAPAISAGDRLIRYTASLVTTTLFAVAVVLWFAAFGVFYLRVVPALLTHDPNEPWGGLQMRLLGDLSAYGRLCEAEARSKVWYYLCAGGWIGGGGLFLLGLATS